MKKSVFVGTLATAALVAGFASATTLEDVKAELACANEPTSTPHALVDEIRAALRDEAGEIVEACDVELHDARAARPPTTSITASTSEPTRPNVVTRHRFDPLLRDRAPVRIITLRDRRRGPPRGGSARHGVDPPR